MAIDMNGIVSHADLGLVEVATSFDAKVVKDTSIGPDSQGNPVCKGSLVKHLVHGVTGRVGGFAGDYKGEPAVYVNYESGNALNRLSKLVVIGED